MAKQKARAYGVNPPYIDLGDAVDIVRKIYEDAGGSISEDELSKMMKNTIGSSSFRRKVLALKNFGLVRQESPGDRIGLSEIGKGVAGATSPTERSQALKTAFMRVDNHRKLYDQFSGKLLPVGEFLSNAIRETCGTSADLTGQWKDSFMQSAKAAGLLQDRADGKIQLRRDPGGSVLGDDVTPGSEENVEPEKPQMAGKPRTPPPIREEVERFHIPLAGEGKAGAVELPKGWTPADVKKMIHVMEAMFLWEEQGNPRTHVVRTPMQS